MSDFALTYEDYRVPAPKRKDYGIGLIGCGGISNGAHLPAYRNAGFRVLACCDVSREAMERTREKWQIPFGTTDYRELLARPEIDIVDLAIHNAGRVELVREIAAAGKHILIQKPFAHRMGDAKAMVDACEPAGVKLAVNQQARWAPAHRAAKILLERGAIGKLYAIAHELRGNQDNPESWYLKVPDFNIVDHGVHYIDLARFWAGCEPRHVHATTVHMPGQHHADPMIYTITLFFNENLQAALSFNNIVQAPGRMGYRFYLDGTEGTIFSDLQAISLYRKDASQSPLWEHKLQGSWFPDAFAGTMGDLMDAVTDDREPLVSGRRNLGALAIAFAAVQSSKEHSVLRLEG